MKFTNQESVRVDKQNPAIYFKKKKKKGRPQKKTKNGDNKKTGRSYIWKYKPRLVNGLFFKALFMKN